MDTPKKFCARREKCLHPQGYELPATLEYFQSDSQKKDGLCAYCKVCSKDKIDKRRYKNNIEEIQKIRAFRKHLKENGEKQCPRCHNVYPTTKAFFAFNVKGQPCQCKTCTSLIHQDIYIRLHKHKVEKRRQYRLENKDKIAQRKREYYYRDIEKTRLKSRKRSAEWRKNNPDKVIASFNRRRARIMNAGGTFTSADIALHLKSQKGLCWYCECDLQKTGYHVEHRVPLSRGGSNAPDNICLSCPTCNLKKGDKLPHEWIGRLI